MSSTKLNLTPKASGYFSKSSSKLFVDPVELEAVYSARNSPQWRRPDDTLTGYAGHQAVGAGDPHVLETHLRRRMIRGYSGFVPESRTVCGTPIIPSEEKQRIKEEEALGIRPMATRQPEPASSEDEDFNSFRQYAKNMDLIERYLEATSRLLDRGQSPEMLLAIVQAKMSERVKSYAEQLISVRKLFEAFDLNGDGVLNEYEFRECLEKLNIQFDDIQSLALFAYFDSGNKGYLKWQDFASQAMVHNPKGGTAVLPKPITSTMKSSTNWERSKSSFAL